MNHISDEDLAILVPGDEPDSATGAHLAGCPDCRSRRAALERMVALVSSAERVPERGPA